MEARFRCEPIVNSGKIVRGFAGSCFVIVLDAAIDVDHLGNAEDRLEPVQEKRIAALALIVRSPDSAPAELIDMNGIATFLVGILAARTARLDDDLAPDWNG